MENQLNRLQTIAIAFIKSYRKAKEDNQGVSYAEVSGKLPCSFQFIKDLVLEFDKQVLNIRTFQRDIITLKQYFGLTITNSGKRDGVYVLKMDKNAINMINNRKLSLKL